MTASNLKAEHQTFIDELAKLIKSSKVKLTDELNASFDLDAILNDPKYGQEIVGKLMFMMEEYLSSAALAGQQFGEIKKEMFKNASS